MKHKIALLWRLKKVWVVPVVVGALEIVMVKVKKWLAKTGTVIRTKILNKQHYLRRTEFGEKSFSCKDMKKCFMNKDIFWVLI